MSAAGRPDPFTHTLTALIDDVAEAIYGTYTAGLDRHAAPPWLALSTVERVQWRTMARVAVSRVHEAMRASDGGPS